MNPLLSKLISNNQFGFVKGRLITEYILLTQEIVHGIRIHKKEGNAFIKLDMTKAYDKMSWTFLISAMRKMGFVEGIIETINLLVSNNWYYVTINGTRFGFLIPPEVSNKEILYLLHSLLLL